MTWLRDRRVALGAITMFTLLAGDFWRYSISWYGWGVIVAIIVAGWIAVAVRHRLDLRRIPIALGTLAALMVASIVWSFYPSLAQLLRSLVDQGVTLVTTSNAEPDALYPDGIQRASFLPAIDLLKRHNNVLRLRGATDYRLRYLEQVPIYLTPLGAAAEARLAEEFGRLAPDAAERDGVLEVNGRPVPFRRRADDCAWFDFEALCGPPRSQNDYIELACCHHTVILSGVPVLDGSTDDKARRFVLLVDELYDRNVNLVATAAAQPQGLYKGVKLRVEFERCVSRLVEMRSHEYLARAHRP